MTVDQLQKHLATLSEYGYGNQEVVFTVSRLIPEKGEVSSWTWEVKTVCQGALLLGDTPEYTELTGGKLIRSFI